MNNPEVFALKDGYVNLLKGPGLGVEMNEDKLKEAQKMGHDWSNPIWRNYDGSFVEW